MRHVLRVAVLLGVVAVVLPSLAQDTAAPEVDKKLIDKALAQPFLQGKIVAVDLEKKSFTIQAVVDSKKTLNKEGQQRYAQLYAQARQAYASKNKAAYEKLLPELQAAYAGIYDVKETTHNFKLHGNGDFQLRIEKLPPREGDDGKFKAYTPQELSKLKGNPNLPGYMADPKQLENDSQVKAYLVKETKGKTPAVKEEPKLVIKTATSGDKPKEAMAEDAHAVSIIMILPKADSMPGLPGAPPPPAGANPFVIK
jgi:hypothetical protein